MTTLNVLYRTGELVRIVASDHEATRAAAELNSRSDVTRAWVETAI